ncbi:MAG: DoxX family protein, partial [Patescibacteria group bacterium]
MQQLADFMQYQNEGLFILRLVMGVIFILHGWPKIKNHKSAAVAMGLPALLVLGVGLIESLGGLALILGLYTQIAAILIGLVMIGAIKMKTINWKTKFIVMGAMGWE